MGAFLFAAPNWEYNPGDYEFTSWIVGGVVLSDGVNINAADDMFAAFDANGNVRGVAAQVIPAGGQYDGVILYEMTMGSNANGDILSFQYYDASTNVILDVNSYVSEIFRMASSDAS